ncbi:mitochondrial 37S ribosomal protein bS21m [Aspergillus undulatus]|uniref:mitochondrial 37S ribosomal protein bS21m n=1 Tax=Aspergillus undulatus TaxID=1810928 RepID=UPI003CCCA0AC
MVIVTVYPRLSMEMRSLTHCLRSRPTTNTLFTNFRHNQMRRTTLQFQTATFASSTPALNENTPPRPQTPRSKNNDIDNVLDMLNLSSNRSNPRAPTTSQLLSSDRDRQAPGQGQRQDAAAAAGNAAATNTNRNNSLSSAAAAGMKRSLPMQTPRLAENRKVQMKLGPSLGREVAVSAERGWDVEGSIKKLHRLLADNNVKYQELSQKFHVRRGQQKKILRIKRWRNLFKYSFSHTVGKIQRMRKQGW